MTRLFGALAEDLGHARTLYGFRHFVATQLGAVATTATIRERMGRGSLEVTGGYVHRVSKADREAVRHMGEVCLTARRSRCSGCWLLWCRGECQGRSSVGPPP